MLLREVLTKSKYYLETIRLRWLAWSFCVEKKKQPYFA